MESHWIHATYWPILSEVGGPTFANISAPEAQYSGMYLIPDYEIPTFEPIRGFTKPRRAVGGYTSIRRVAGSPYSYLKAKYDRYFGSPDGYPLF